MAKKRVKKNQNNMEKIVNHIEKTRKNRVKKIINWIITGFFAALIGGLVIFNLVNKYSGNDYIFGAQYPMVLTDSMEPEYMVGDVLVIKKIDHFDTLVDQYRAGDDGILSTEDDATSVVIGDQETLTNGATIDLTFNYDIAGIGEEYSVTHRLSQIVIYNNTDEGEGKFSFTCHGINTDSEQCSTNGGDCTTQTQTFNETKVIGEVRGVSTFLTFVYKIFTSVWGLLILILIPALYLIITSVIDIVNTLNGKEEKAPSPSIDQDLKDNALTNLSDEDKERLKKDLLEELLKKEKKSS